MKKTIIGALAVSTLLLSACSTSQPMWRKAGITPHDVNNALAKCRYDVGLAKVNQNEKTTTNRIGCDSHSLRKGKRNN